MSNGKNRWDLWEAEERRADFDAERRETFPIRIGAWLGVPIFIAGWLYCATKYGFLWGFGFGWLPSAILAALVAAAVAATIVIMRD